MFGAAEGCSLATPPNRGPVVSASLGRSIDITPALRSWQAGRGVRYGWPWRRGAGTPFFRAPTGSAGGPPSASRTPPGGARRGLPPPGPPRQARPAHPPGLPIRPAAHAASSDPKARWRGLEEATPVALVPGAGPFRGPAARHCGTRVIGEACCAAFSWYIRGWQMPRVGREVVHSGADRDIS
jgi:hypothetical protein